MSHISILIVDDDLPKIASIIKSIQAIYEAPLHFKQASCVQEAVEALQNEKFHLLITDLQMPLKHDDSTNDNGGEVLIRNLYKAKNRLNVPMYVVGLTQYPHLQTQYKGVWKIWHYDGANEDWKTNFRDLIFHISLVMKTSYNTKIETVFVEGISDKILLEALLKSSFPEAYQAVHFETVRYGGGASWVERQLLIWGKSLLKKENSENFLKAVGIFDNDIAGNSAISRLRSVIANKSTEAKTFSTIKTSYKFSVLLKAIKKKGIRFETSIEDLLSVSCWREAERLGWLEDRPAKLLEVDRASGLPETLSSSILGTCGFSDDEILYVIKRVKKDHKNSILTLAKESPYINEQESLRFLLAEVISKLKLPEFSEVK